MKKLIRLWLSFYFFGANVMVYSFDLHLDQGWNLVSFSIDKDLSIKGILEQSIVSDKVKIWSYSSVWSSFDSERDLNSLQSFVPNMAYWIKVQQKSILVYDACVADTVFSLNHSGWNLLGSSYNSYTLKNIDKSLLAYQDDFSILKIWSYSEKVWLKYEPNHSKGNLAYIEKNHGYWCKVKSIESSFSPISIVLKDDRSEVDQYKSIQVPWGFSFDDIHNLSILVSIHNLNDLPIANTYVKVS
ncbi:hypothetical protein MJH12_13850, partial [bacterium]|nr:hypothetical protein [bacterium]